VVPVLASVRELALALELVSALAPELAPVPVLAPAWHKPQPAA